MFNSSTNQKLFKKHLCNQNSNYEKYGRFSLQREPSRTTAKLTLFAANKDEWDTKEDTGKSMKNALCCDMPKGTSRAEATSNSEKIKPIALAVIELRLSKGISQSVSQSFTCSVSGKFC